MQCVVNLSDWTRCRCKTSSSVKASLIEQWRRKML